MIDNESLGTFTYDQPRATLETSARRVTLLVMVLRMRSRLCSMLLPNLTTDSESQSTKAEHWLSIHPRCTGPVLPCQPPCATRQSHHPSKRCENSLSECTARRSFT